ncbi:hypothetical protein BX616_010024, partial [Lobosporangium transversale]
DHEASPLPPCIVEGQLKICQLAAERYPKCYYAWTMRHWLVEQLGRHWWNASLKYGFNHGYSHGHESNSNDSFSKHSRGHLINDPNSLLEPLVQELERMRAHMQRNVSDHSSLQHLQQCMIQLSGHWIVLQQRAQSEEQEEPERQRHQQPSSPLSSSPSSSHYVLQWSRKELQQRQHKRDQWFNLEAATTKASTIPSMPVMNHQRSAIRSVLPSAVATFILNASDDGDADQTMADEMASFRWVCHLWLYELKRTRNLIRIYPGHESLWYHLRFVYYGLRWLDSSEIDTAPVFVLGENMKDANQGSKNQDSDHNLLVSPTTEGAFVDQLLKQKEGLSLLDEGKDEQQRYCAERYLDWVRRLDMDIEGA